MKAIAACTIALGVIAIWMISSSNIDVFAAGERGRLSEEAKAIAFLRLLNTKEAQVFKARGRYASLQEITSSSEDINRKGQIGPYSLIAEVMDNAYSVYATRLPGRHNKLALSFYTDASGMVRGHYGPGRASAADPIAYASFP